MISACQQPGVIGVAFNIPKDPGSRNAAYEAPPGEFKPVGALTPMPTLPENGNRMMFPPERAFTIEKSMLPAVPKPAQAVSVPVLFRYET